MGVNSFPKTVTRQRRGCDLNPGPTAPESSTLTTRLLSHPWASGHTERNTHQIDCSAWTTNVVDCDTCVSQPARISICFDVVSWESMTTHYRQKWRTSYPRILMPYHWTLTYIHCVTKTSTFYFLNNSDLFEFTKVKWQHMIGEVGRSVRYSCPILLGFNYRNLLKSVYFDKNKMIEVSFLRHWVDTHTY